MIYDTSDTGTTARCRIPGTACAPRLRFRPLRQADIPAVNALLQAVRSRTCDYSIGGIYMWIDWFKYEYCVLDDTLFIKGRTEDRPRETAFMLPVGSMPLVDAVDAVRLYCEDEGIPPVFSAVPADRLDEFTASFPAARPELLADWADYLYDIRSLATFAGKQMMKKRNHYNRFVAENPHFRFEPLDHRNLTEALAFFDTLGGEASRIPNQADGIGRLPETELALFESDQCRKVLCLLSSYPFEGAVLRTEDGHIAALTVGEVIGDTLYVHIEKMRHDSNGAGPAVCRLFAAMMQELHPALRYVNREEDCGDPGLRDAKLSYHPAAVLPKFNLRL